MGLPISFANRPGLAGNASSHAADEAVNRREAPAPEAIQAERKSEVDAKELQQAVRQARSSLLEKSRELTFEFSEETGRVIVRLVDTRTREVLRQIPSEEMLQIARALSRGDAEGALLRVDA